jgi:hypothetical protein
MSKPSANPFFEADFSKMMDMTKMMDMSKMMDVSKMMGDMKMQAPNMEAIMSVQRRNIEAFSALGQAAFESMQALGRRQAEMVRETMQETANMMNSVMSSPSAEDKVIRQAEVSKAVVDKCIASARDISETLSKSNTQAMETVSNRLSESIEELRGIIKTTAVRAA